MKIKRWGSERNCGVSEIEFPSPRFRFQGSEIIVSDSNVKDFLKAETTHDYDIHISLKEIVSLIDELSKAATDNPNLFKSNLKESEQSLFRLTAIVNGAKYQSSLMEKLEKLKKLKI